MKTEWPPAIFLMGPTAAGKTDLAVRLVEHLPCEIISVDSGLIYRGMDIGTAKPGPDVLVKAPHRLIDIREPYEVYSAAEFRADALEAMAEIVRGGRIPLLVGGTMLYFKVLLEGIAVLPAADAEVRKDIQARADRLGWQALHEELARIDPLAAQKIHPNNPQRLMRALEVLALTGLPLGEHWRHQHEAVREKLPYNVFSLAVAPQDRAVLHRRIEIRFQQMLQAGFVDEVRTLHLHPRMTAAMPAARTVGYRQIWQYLDGVIGYDEMVRSGIAATRQLAKRQLTWLRGWSDLHWIGSKTNILQDVLKQLSNSAI